MERRQPSRQPCPKSSRLPLFKAIWLIPETACAYRGLEQAPDPYFEPSSRTQQCLHQGARPPCHQLLQEHLPHVGCPGEGTGTSKYSTLLAKGRCGLRCCSPGLSIPPARGEDDTLECSTGELRTGAPLGNNVCGVWPP